MRRHLAHRLPLKLLWIANNCFRSQRRGAGPRFAWPATVNAGGRLVARATRVGADTALAQIGRLVTAAQSGKAPVQRLADRVSAVFVPVVIALSLATLAGWLLAGASATQAFTAAVAVLIIACPCALGLATPTALLVGTGRGAQLGVLIKGPEVLESTRRADTVVLDKTGTITTGQMALADLHTAPGTSRSDAVRMAGAVEAASEHPIARAIAAAAAAEVGSLPAVSGFRSTSGLGVTGEVEGHSVVIGRPAFLARAGLTPGPQFEVAVSAAEERGQTPLLARWDDHVGAMFVVADQIKPNSGDAVAQLRSVGLTPILLTGDNARAAHAVADAVGIEAVRAEVLPEGKVAVVRDLQSRGGSWQWSATVSTTRPPWSKPIWASPWAPAPTSPSKPAT